MNSKFHFFFFTKCIRNINMNIIFIQIHCINTLCLRRFLNKFILNLKTINLPCRQIYSRYFLLPRKQQWNQIQLDWSFQYSQALLEVIRREIKIYIWKRKKEGNESKFNVLMGKQWFFCWCIVFITEVCSLVLVSFDWLSMELRRNLACGFWNQIYKKNIMRSRKYISFLIWCYFVT
jgi:hypothetical protein